MVSMHGDNFPRKLIFEHYIKGTIHRDFQIDVLEYIASVVNMRIGGGGSYMLQCGIADPLYVVCATVGVAKWFLAKCARNTQAI